MGCKFCNFDGECQMYEEGSNIGELGVSLGENGEPFCVVEDDPEPEDSCDYYESDGNEDNYDEDEDDDDF